MNKSKNDAIGMVITHRGEFKITFNVLLTLFTQGKILADPCGCAKAYAQALACKHGHSQPKEFFDFEFYGLT